MSCFIKSRDTSLDSYQIILENHLFQHFCWVNANPSHRIHIRSFFSMQVYKEKRRNLFSTPNYSENNSQKLPNIYNLNSINRCKQFFPQQSNKGFHCCTQSEKISISYYSATNTLCFFHVISIFWLCQITELSTEVQIRGACEKKITGHSSTCHLANT